MSCESKNAATHSALPSRETAGDFNQLVGLYIEIIQNYILIYINVIIFILTHIIYVNLKLEMNPQCPKHQCQHQVQHWSKGRPLIVEILCDGIIQAQKDEVGQ